MNTIIIQIRLENDGAGDIKALKKRHKLESELKNILRLMNAYVDGGQAGVGSMEIFINGVQDIDFCLDLILEFLKSKELKGDYKVAWLPDKKIDGNPHTKWNMAFASNKSTVFSFNPWSFDG